MSPAQSVENDWQRPNALRVYYLYHLLLTCKTGAWYYGTASTSGIQQAVIKLLTEHLFTLGMATFKNHFLSCCLKINIK